MRIRKFHLATMFALLCAAATASAQETIRITDDEAQAAADSGADLSVPVAPATASIDVSDASYAADTVVLSADCDGEGADDACDDSCCGGFCSTLESFTLKNLLGREESPWEIGGWTQIGYHDNNQPLSQAYNDLLSFNDVPDRVNLQQQWLYLGKVADGSCGLGFGGRIDILYGTDAQKTQAFGNPNAGIRGDGSFDASMDHGSYGWAIPQLYGEVAYNDLSVKIGHFFTTIGYEVIPSTGNFFYSHSYTKFNSEPFTHTGVMATYTGYENISLHGCWALGWDTGFDQLNQGNLFLGGFTATLTEGVSFAYAATYGNFGWRDGGADNSYSHSMVLSAALTERLTYIAQSDYIRTDNPPISNFDTIGLNNYLIYKWSDALGLGFRHEWWKADGVSFNAVTGGINIYLCENLLFRPEIRKDWAPGIGLDEEVFGIDMILKY